MRKLPSSTGIRTWASRLICVHPNQNAMDADCMSRGSKPMQGLSINCYYESVTQTRTETTILQEEMEVVFDPPSVVQSISEEGCSVASEEIQTRIETTKSQEDMKGDFDALSDVPSLSKEDCSTTLQEEIEEYFDALSVVPSLSEEDSEDAEKDFLEYLVEVGLKEYFPRKLTMKKATEVRLFPATITD
ncbi:hypothetical protein BSL78_09516 [Apostichopus japonicus]|uniref:Uncharacterized protein n=1 Tax=Stichopus japonicus TaxID=307972 RepID=A0A2G8L019_STIJA|nr:hypothetical protein BSL78_09516 [Apostichopus japonicus]